MDRREFLKKCAGVAGGFVLSNKVLKVNIGGKHPNIVLIFIDDMGWTGTSFMGSKYYETPRIDKLAGEGMVFKSAYTCAPNCAPTRACLMSGQYTPRHGVYTVGSSERGESRLRRLIPIPNTTTLDPAIVTVAEALKPAGYVSACIGKWHLGDAGQFNPAAQGFDVSVSRGDLDSDPDDPKRIYGLTDAAIRFIESNKDRPFFLYLSHHAVHTPVEATDELIDKYQDNPPWDGHDNPEYAAMTEHTDDGVGRVLDKLDELKLTDNTVVLFYSDNGGAGKQTSNSPLRGAKGMLYEGGIRVPMAVRWPGVVKPGTSCDVPVNSVDFYPTFLEIATAARPANHILDGESIVPLLRGANSMKRNAIFWHCPVYLQGNNYEGARDSYFRTRPVGAIREGDWKLMQYFEQLEFGDGDQVQLELYNLVDDIGEENNLAKTMPDKRDELLDALVAWRQSVNAPVPTEHNPGYTG
jgi:arylsulfatase A-like enzyme